MMKRVDFEATLRSFLWRKPFRPFIIEMEDGQKVTIERRESLSYFAGDEAMLLDPDGPFAFIDRDYVIRIADAEIPASS